MLLVFLELGDRSGQLVRRFAQSSNALDVLEGSVFPRAAH
jgi:hypothetical protein